MRGWAALLILLAGPGLAETGPAPFADRIGGAFELTDQHGNRRGAADPLGRMQLLFFGYATCEEICSAALPLIAGAAEALTARGLPTVPVMVTVDPARDTVTALGPALARIGDGIVGLTGSAAEVATVHALFGVETHEVFTGPTGPVYAHGSFVYLLDPGGRVMTVLPPVLAEAELAGIAARYAQAAPLASRAESR